ncbi:MAG: cell division protein FtsL [Clostridia bacterium]|nr:cell division protein FtsL [Clostridia bacterium]MBR4261145.1 cell division protein FtsL [Clostridia bacterium]
MADRFYGYQYGTSPRKLDYSSYGRRYPQDKEPVTTTNRDYLNNRNNYEQYAYTRNSRTNRQVTKSKVNNDFQDNTKTEKNTKLTKATMKAKIRIISLLFAGFAILFAVSYQNSLISESFNKKEQYKKEWESLSKTNQQIEVSIENNLNLNNIEQVAKEKLGMQKLSNDQKIYVNLPKEDYVSSAAEQVVIEEDQNFFVKLFKGFTKAIK